MRNGARPEIGTTRFAGKPGSTTPGPEDAATAPYGRPVIKEPVWTWEIPVYFYTGGLAGASAALGVLAEARGNDKLARRAFDVAAAGSVVSPALLISDLGQPKRFLYMLRMFKVTSPMSVGSWLLAVFGGATGLGWLAKRTRPNSITGRALRALAGALGLPLSSYTAALVANSAVPAWHETREMLPYVFVSGAAMSAGGALTALLDPDDAAPARRLAIIGAAGELITKELMEHSLGDLSDAYEEGTAHKISLVGKTSSAVGLTLLVTRAGRSRGAAVAGGLLVNVGAVIARWSVFEAGKWSAGHPFQTVGPQRERIESGASRGASIRQARPGVPAGHGSPGRGDAVEAGKPTTQAADAG